MTTIRSGRRSSFGTSCIQCGNELIAPETSEYWGEYWSDAHVCHIWRCAKCSCRFESLITFQADTKSRYQDREGYLPVAVPVSVGRIGQFEGCGSLGLGRGRLPLAKGIEMVAATFPQSNASFYAKLCSFGKRPVSRRSTHLDCCQHPGQFPRR
jgi:hypothetical protein